MRFLTNTFQLPNNLEQQLEMGANQVIEKPVDLPKLNAAYAACVQGADDDQVYEQQA